MVEASLIQKRLLYLGAITAFCAGLMSSSGCKTSLITTHTATSIFSSENTLNVLESIEERGFLRIGTTGDFMPFSFHLGGDTSEYYGIDIELGKYLAHSLDVNAQFVRTSWPSLLHGLNEGRFDICMSGVTIKLDRQRVGLFSTPSWSGGKAAIARDVDSSRFITIDSINQPDVRVIVNPGGTNEIFALTHFPNARVIHNEDNVSIFQRIVDDEADVMVTDAIETVIQEMLHPELEAINPDQPFNSFEMGFLLPRDVIWKEYVDQWLKLRKNNGTYNAIFEQEMKRIKDHTLGRKRQK